MQKTSPKEECPRLVLPPFSKKPQVVFDGVLLGTTCVRELEISNPTKQVQKIALGKELPPGLVIDLPGEWLVLEPETCSSLTMMWTPEQSTASLETIWFMNEQRDTYNVVVFLKSVTEEDIQRKKEEDRRCWAASVIQAHYRAYKLRAATAAAEKREAKIRQRWRMGALNSIQLTLKERTKAAMQALRYEPGMDAVIRAFRSLDILTEVYPKIYVDCASLVVRYVYAFMSTSNRSLSSVEMLERGSAVLVNLTRYCDTGRIIYDRNRIPLVLTCMLRCSNSEMKLVCILCTYLWLFSKYDGIREDLTQFLNLPKNQKMMATIKGNVERMKRMASNARNKNSNTNFGACFNSVRNEDPVLPALESDYGITKAGKPRFFKDASHAISCLCQTYNLIRIV